MRKFTLLLQRTSTSFRKRKTISKQIEKVKAEITRLEALTTTLVTVDPSRWRCRTCGDWNDICDGNCWGYFQAPALAEGGTRSLEEQRKLPHKVSPARQSIEPLS